MPWQASCQTCMACKRPGVRVPLAPPAQTSCLLIAWTRFVAALGVHQLWCAGQDVLCCVAGGQSLPVTGFTFLPRERYRRARYRRDRAVAFTEHGHGGRTYTSRSAGVRVRGEPWDAVR